MVNVTSIRFLLRSLAPAGVLVVEMTGVGQNAEVSDTTDDAMKNKSWKTT